MPAWLKSNIQGQAALKMDGVLPEAQGPRPDRRVFATLNRGRCSYCQLDTNVFLLLAYSQNLTQCGKMTIKDHWTPCPAYCPRSSLLTPATLDK